LGNPPANGIKLFAASELLELVKDRAWLANVTNALNQHWLKKNAAKQHFPASVSHKLSGVCADQSSAVGA
jgi:hypothetical protein